VPHTHRTSQFRIVGGVVYTIAAAGLAGSSATLTYLADKTVLVHGVSPAAPYARRSGAVLGFKNLSGDAQEAWLSTALSDCS